MKWQNDFGSIVISNDTLGGNVPVPDVTTVQTLEGDINRKLDDMYKEEGDKYYKEKRPLS